MTHRDLTIAEVLKDPLIRQVMRADRISVSRMENLLHDAARRQALALSANLASANIAPIAHVATPSVPRIDLR
ncbi:MULTISPECIES: hypothetical protein [unclassified Rhizobium]|uniref:hypothetical protein n=1 Tax=unclassified Rhizobium TaxID=2613769 RepID=UPI000DDD38EA|nr:MULTISPECIES: hypothetical protein [unclassified Rhizobium]MBB3285733.1 hypothetical protein [Rhizobium sp. BK252]MBB3400473.1 hypothetical protein [Rhizobium sp. BK289]MBB3413052.1 hypothetical protein [Rhizobium sp. BK284]MBB3480939.1 hypothetical protein [Rhizobium sp. BK347]MDK4721613.1 hypothetical protein [Rhizobium sp. CNPSo 3968]